MSAHRFSVSCLAAAALLGACSDAPDSTSPAPASAAAPTPSAQENEEAALSAYERGARLAAQGELSAAADAYRRALELDPALAPAHHALGRTLVALANTTVGRGGEELDESGVGVRLGRDPEVLREGVAHLERAVELAPRDAEHAYWAGRALHVAGRDEEAVAMLERAVELDPEHGLAHKRLGLVRLHRGALDEAEADFRAAARWLPEDPGVPFQLGNLLSEDDPQEARAAFERALEIDPTFPWAHHGLASVLARLGDAEGAARAQEAFERWRELDERVQAAAERAARRADDPEAQILAGELFFARRQWEQALEFFRRALRQREDDPYLHLHCGIALRELGQLETARHHLEEAAFLAPQAFYPRLELLRLFARAAAGGQRSEADQGRLEELQSELSERAPSLTEAERLDLAEVFSELGATDEARAQIDALLAEDPQHEAARAALERVEARAGAHGEQ